MEQPKYYEYMLPELRILKDNRIYERHKLINMAAAVLGVTEEQKSELISSGSPRYLGRGSWGLTYLKQAGLIYSPRRAMFQITQEGLKFLEKSPNSLTVEDLQQFDAFRDFQQRTSQHVNRIKQNVVIDSEQDPTELMQTTYEIMKQNVCDELLHKILEHDPYAFERLVVELVVAMGYGGNIEDAGKATKKSGDDGIDGVINEDKLGLGKIYLQAKRYALDHPVGSQEIQTFTGALNLKGAKKGIFIATSSFSPRAQELVEHSNIPIALIDGQKLSNYMYEYNLGVAPEKKYEIKKIDTDYFDNV